MAASVAPANSAWAIAHPSTASRHRYASTRNQPDCEESHAWTPATAVNTNVVDANASNDHTLESPTIAAAVIRAARARRGNRSPATVTSMSSIGIPKRSGPDWGSEPMG